MIEDAIVSHVDISPQKINKNIDLNNIGRSYYIGRYSLFRYLFLFCQPFRKKDVSQYTYATEIPSSQHNILYNYKL